MTLGWRLSDPEPDTGHPPGDTQPVRDVQCQAGQAGAEEMKAEGGAVES